MSDRRDEIPKEFPIREQALVVHQAARMKEDFIAKQRSKGKMSDEDMNLQAYSVAVLDAAARTLKALHADRKAGLVHPEPEQIQQIAPVVEEIPPAPPEIVHPDDAPMVRSLDDDGF